MELIALILAIVFFVIGFIGTIIPVLPGVTLIYGGMLLYGFMTGFSSLDANFFILQTLALLLIIATDFFASALGTRKFGGSKQSAWGAILGTIPGLIFLGPIGIILGPFLGAVLVEMLLGKEVRQAVNVGFGTLIGFIGGTLLKLIAETIMVVYFFMQI
ncbi:MAG: DUF456 domain-containing protein [Bacillota bacterium]